jgi:hypothetical protein
MKVSSTPVLDAQKRARQYWHSDGFASLLLGVALFVFGLGNLFDHLQHRHSWTFLLSLLTGSIGALIIYRDREIVEWLKIRVTYPRTGYVQPPPGAELFLTERQTPSPSRSSAIRSVIGFVLVIVGFYVFFMSQSRWAWPIFGLTCGISAWLGRQRRPISIASWFFLLITACFTIFPPPQALRSDVLCLATGIGMFLDGAMRLIRYIRRNPIPKVPTA